MSHARPALLAPKCTLMLSDPILAGTSTLLTSWAQQRHKAHAACTSLLKRSWQSPPSWRLFPANPPRLTRQTPAEGATSSTPRSGSPSREAHWVDNGTIPSKASCQGCSNTNRGMRGHNLVNTATRPARDDPLLPTPHTEARHRAGQRVRVDRIGQLLVAACGPSKCAMSFEGHPAHRGLSCKPLDALRSLTSCPARRPACTGPKWW